MRLFGTPIVIRPSFAPSIMQRLLCRRPIETGSRVVRRRKVPESLKELSTRIPVIVLEAYPTLTRNDEQSLLFPNVCLESFGA